MATYDPNKRYTWTPNDKFELSGAEFGMVLNAFRATLATEEASRILLISEANNAVERALAAAVEADVVKEAPEQQPQTNL
jgi:hypothetical protein|tara:strand:+ start:656 stop:895 length:240 start_codon:yes stop_codon:yes gene_type:complete